MTSLQPLTVARENSARRQTERVLLVHCSASSPGQWSNLEECLSPGFDVYAWTLAGHGERDGWSGIEPLTIEAEVEGISVQFASTAGSLHVVGHSYGGAVALRFALSNSKRIRTLTLIEPVCFHFLRDNAKFAAEYQEVRKVAQELGRSVLRGDYYAGMQSFVDYWGEPGSWDQLSNDQKKAFATRAVHVAPHFEALFNEHISLAHCASIRTPTLILSGTKSPNPTQRISELLTASIPMSRHQVLEGAGHMAPITHAQQVNSHIINHILSNPVKSD